VAPRQALIGRAEFDRLKSQCESLQHQVASLIEATREQAASLKIQFTRIAEMQAILDVEATEAARRPSASARRQ
jgi:hypothetical protein